ncbi:MAG: SMI1/KNR4 family protein [Chloroflexota bacterium]
MIEIIKEKLILLKQLDKDYKVSGARIHKYINSKVSEAELVRVEDKLGVKLPQDYRTFLIKIGYGAGPCHNLMSPEEILAHHLDGLNYFQAIESPTVSPATPFPFTIQDAYRGYENQEQDFWADATIDSIYPENGAITIGEDGATAGVCLITSGELAGSIWEVVNLAWGEAMWYPASVHMGIISMENSKKRVRIDRPILLFYEWYDLWLEQSLNDVSTYYR